MILRQVKSPMICIAVVMGRGTICMIHTCEYIVQILDFGHLECCIPTTSRLHVKTVATSIPSNLVAQKDGEEKVQVDVSLSKIGTTTHSGTKGMTLVSCPLAQPSMERFACRETMILRQHTLTDADWSPKDV